MLMLTSITFISTIPIQATPVMWALQNVTFSDGGTASGSFMFDADTNVVSSWNISVNGGNVKLFPAFTYSPSTSSFAAVSDGLITAFIFHGPLSPMINPNPYSTRDFRLAFATPLSNAGGVDALPLTGPGNGNGFANVECYNCIPYRTFVSGSVVGTSTDVCNGATLDQSNSNHAIGGADVGSGNCAWTFTVTNLEPYLWLDISKTIFGFATAVPADAASNLYAQAGILAPGKSIVYSVQFTKPNQDVNVFANLTGSALDLAMNINIVQGIIDAISIGIPAGTIELGIADAAQISEVIKEMPHFEAAIAAFSDFDCYVQSCKGGPALGFRALIEFAESPTEPKLLVGLLGQLGVDVSTTAVTTITHTPGAIAAVLLEVASNVHTAFFGSTAGSVSLTAN